MEKQNSLALNAIFSFIKTFLGVVFPIITFAYSSRILGVEGVGSVTFARTTITYFTMIALLGVNYYGTREVAKIRNNINKLSKFCQEMLILNGFMTIVAYILLLCSMLVISKFKDYTLLLWVNSISIVLTSLGMDWLYQGLEQFKYIAKRTILFQIIALIYMLLTVKSSNDILNYSIVLIISSTGANILNFINSRKYIDYSKFSLSFNLKKHIKPLLWLFAFAVSIELYTVMDSTMLGFIKGDYAVGIYSVAIKANKMTDTLITSLGVALIPRLAYYISLKKTKETKKLIKSVYNYIFMFSIPCCLGMIVLAPSVIQLFSGKGFEDAVITMRLLTPIVFIIPFNVLSNIQIFIPMKKERWVLISSFSSAIINFVCNMFLINLFSENGAAIATVIAELTTALICLIFLRKIADIKVIFNNYYQYWVSAVPILAVGYLTDYFIDNYILNIIVVVFFSALIYFSILKLFKNEYLNLATIEIKTRLKNMKRRIYG